MWNRKSLSQSIQKLKASLCRQTDRPKTICLRISYSRGIKISKITHTVFIATCVIYQCMCITAILRGIISIIHFDMYALYYTFFTRETLIYFHCMKKSAAHVAIQYLHTLYVRGFHWQEGLISIPWIWIAEVILSLSMQRQGWNLQVQLRQ